MIMNLKSRTLITLIAVFSVILFVTELEARRLGGGGAGLRAGGGIGAGSFSRGGIASRGGFSTQRGNLSTRTTQRSPTRMDNRTGSLGEIKGNRLDNRGDNIKHRQDDRQAWKDKDREDRQDAIRGRQDDRQDFIDDKLDDDWDGCRGDCDGVVAGVVVGAAIGAAAARDNHYDHYSVIYTLPCSTTAVVFNNVSYYNCSNVWYERVYSGGNVTYVMTTPPPGH